MKKGISETFDEHEQKTAPHGYPTGVPDSVSGPDPRAQATSKMSKFALETVLRTASGTRPAAGLNQAIKDEMTKQAAEDADQSEEHVIDEFARPTLDIVPPSFKPLAPPTPLAFVPIPIEATLLDASSSEPATEDRSGTVAVTPAIAKVLEGAPEQPKPSSRPAAPPSVHPAKSERPIARVSMVSSATRVPSWALVVVLAGLVLLLSAAGLLGFLFGRHP